MRGGQETNKEGVCVKERERRGKREKGERKREVLGERDKNIREKERQGKYWKRDRGNTEREIENTEEGKEIDRNG
jgi:hypothetical protein